RLATALERLDALHGGPHELLDAGEALRAALLADLEDAVLGLVQQLGRVHPALVRLADERRTGLDQAALERLLLDDLGMVLDVGRCGDRVDEERDILLPA